MIKQILKKTLAGFFLLTAIPGMATPDKAALSKATKLIASKNAALLFAENRGQITDIQGHPRPDIIYTAQHKNTTIFLSTTGISYQFTRINYPAGYQPFTPTLSPKKQADQEQKIRTETYNFSLTLEGATPHPHIISQEKSITEHNFYLTQCPNGITHVATYRKVVYEEVYPHIDWVVYSNGSHLKYDFLVAIRHSSG